MEIRLTVNNGFVETLQKDLNTANASEIARSALSLLNWVVQERKAGRQIVSASEKTGEPTSRLAMPILDMIEQTQRENSATKESASQSSAREQLAG